MRSGLRWGAAWGVAAAVLMGACSDDDASGATTTEAEVATDDASGEPDRPVGPVSDLEAITGTEAPYLGEGEPFDAEAGYIQEEFVASGTATAYAPVGELASDGAWTLEAGETADYRTRVLVRRPEDDAEFSGTVIVEWLNVSGGVDANPDFVSLREEIERQGHAWVGVSAQEIGVDGGPVLVAVEGVPGSEDAGRGLSDIDPERYGTLEHPGDAFSYDIFSQVAGAVREGGATGGEAPGTVVAAGESQSAAALVSYINGFQLMTQAFDGFFVHSRGAGPLPIPAVGEFADMAGSMGGEPTRFRTDLEVPVLDLQAENDVVGVLNSYAARQPDSENLRLWEVAGTAHADRHLIGESNVEFIDCGVPINDGPMHVVAKAAFRQFLAWVQDGTPPSEAPLLEVSEDTQPAVLRDPDGIALGGVRTPPVDVPTSELSGVPGPNPDVICILLGSSRPLAADRLSELYESVEDYEDAYVASVDEAIAAGWILEEDREAIESFAAPEMVPT